MEKQKEKTQSEPVVYKMPTASQLLKSSLGIKNAEPVNERENFESSTGEEIVKPSKVLMEWTAPERMFETKSREYYRRIAVIIIFFMLLFVVIKELILILVLGAVFFAVYAFHTVPPRDVTHQITTNGVNFASEHLYRWNELKDFFIKENEKGKTLFINTIAPLPGRIIMLLGDKAKHQEISELLNQYISIIEKPEEEPLDKLSSALSKRIKF